MKKLLLTLLVILVALAAVGAAGFAGYRFGYAQGVQVTANGETPNLRPFDRMGPGRMPRDHFGMDRDFQRGFGRHGFPMMGFGVFSLLRFVIQLAVLGLIAWFAYWLFTRSGWQLTRRTAEPRKLHQTRKPQTARLRTRKANRRGHKPSRKISERVF